FNVHSKIATPLPSTKRRRGERGIFSRVLASRQLDAMMSTQPRPAEPAAGLNDALYRFTHSLTVPIPSVDA
ncbi:hypothetical protein ACUHOI_005062, partial [Pseudomonas aeruginosa]